MEDEVRIPDVEVIVGASSHDVAVFSFYKRGDIHQGYDVVAGVSGQVSRSAVSTILQDCIKTLSSPSWLAVDDLRALADEETKDTPF